MPVMFDDGDLRDKKVVGIDPTNGDLLVDWGGDLRRFDLYVTASAGLKVKPKSSASKTNGDVPDQLVKREATSTAAMMAGIDQLRTA